MGILRHPWLLTTLALGELLLMTATEFLFLRRLSGGLPSLDLRPAGFSYDEGVAWLTALGPTGAQSVLVWHYLTLDLLFPALFGLAMASLILHFGEQLPRFSRIGETAKLVIALLAVATYVGFDYAQNWATMRILSDPLGAGPADFRLASALNVLKFFGLAVPLVLISVFALGALRYRDTK